MMNLKEREIILESFYVFLIHKTYKLKHLLELEFCLLGLTYDDGSDTSISEDLPN